MSTSDSNELENTLTFLRNAEQLKNTLRSAYTTSGKQESAAEHSWRLCLMVMLFEKTYPDIDMLKLLKLCIIHDLGEAISGDIPAIEQQHLPDKQAEERSDFIHLISPLSDDQQTELLSLWDEYDQAKTPEAKLAKAFDKIETILQHTQGKNPKDFHYGFNLEYGRNYTDFDAVTTALRAMIDKDTERLAKENGTI